MKNNEPRVFKRMQVSLKVRQEVKNIDRQHTQRGLKYHIMLLNWKIPVSDYFSKNGVLQKKCSFLVEPVLKCVHTLEPALVVR